jgi:diguanylate cyclase (GGDEF)-like protein
MMIQSDTAHARSVSPVPKFSASPQVAPVEAEPFRAVEHLVEVVQHLALAKDIPEIMAIVRTAARRLTGADGASFVLRDGDHCFYADEDAIAPLWKGQRFPMSICVSGWVMNSRQSAVIPDIFKDSRVPVDAYRPTFVRSMVMVPIRTQDPIGAIGNYWAQIYTPTPEQLRILQALADSTAVAMENVRILQELEERVKQRTGELEAANKELRSEAILRKQMEAKVLHLSLTDELTGLNNRRGFLLHANQLLKLVRRVHTHGWLIYIDLDGLKQVNDQRGHEAGDQLIRNAAKVLRESFRDSDIVGRIGGDEFVVFATGTSTPVTGVEVRLKQNIEHHNQSYPEQPQLSMSIGVIRCDPHALHTLEDMIYQADAAMYIEKRRKRDRLRNGAQE